MLAAVFPQYLPSLIPAEGLRTSIGHYSWTSSAISIWGYTVSFSIFLTLILSLLLGAWADAAGARRIFFGLFSLVGAIATICLGFFQNWHVVLITFIIANIGFSGGNVFYNSLLPSVAKEKDWDELSLKAYAWGYISGGLMLAFNLLLILKHDWFGLSSKADGTRLSFILVGIWWLLFSLPAVLFIHERKKTDHKFQVSIRNRLKKILELFWNLPKQRMLFIFILAYALYNDGIQTVISMAAIFGKEVVQLNSSTIIGALLLIQILGWPLTLFMTKLSRRWGARNLLSTSIIIWIGIVGYAFLMKSALDFWVLGILVAIVLGASQALTRSIFTRFIPAGRHAEYFSIYALSGKFASIFGPLLFALVKDTTGNARLAILSLEILFVCGYLLLQLVSIDPSSSP